MTKSVTSSRGNQYHVERPNILVPSDWKAIAHDGDADDVIDSLLGLIDDQVTSIDYPNFCIFVFGKNDGSPGSLMLALLREKISD